MRREMSFHEKAKIQVDKEFDRVRLAMRVNENTITVYALKIDEFKKLVASFNAQMKG
jgi:hypothetical protein